MNRKRNQVIIYGGAFNPPTIAHYLIVKRLLKEAKDKGAELWLMPSGTRPDKEITVPSETRIGYLEALMADLDCQGVAVKIKRYELERKVMTETIDTVRFLKRNHPTKHFVWVFGADSFLTMKQWRGGDELYVRLDKIAVSRPGYMLETLPPCTTLVAVETPEVSSTLVRNLVGSGQPVIGLVPPRVNALLTRHVQ
ncbi:TPA: hypothetical protein DCF80_03600 [Candidatus Saccharibacteria bacterium]|nr:hypothetical protein [Candidatus Saccharibacteria bacterium]HRK40697.1 nicotinate-nicotinamide nucleotide adenylyltransferase [Candidatus Saccharibacteria bacterium]